MSLLLVGGWGHSRWQQGCIAIHGAREVRVIRPGRQPRGRQPGGRLGKRRAGAVGSGGAAEGSDEGFGGVVGEELAKASDEGAGGVVGK